MTGGPPLEVFGMWRKGAIPGDSHLREDMTVTQEDFDSLTALYSDPDSRLRWSLVFTLPAWLKVWWPRFGSGGELYLRSIRKDGQISGIAPLQIRNETASIIGSVDVCDYQDFIIAPGLEDHFYNAILDDLIREGVREFHLETVRPDSTIVNYLIPLARKRGYPVDYQQVDVSSDIELPSTWEGYLNMLDRKQRHEVRRKIRNLQGIGDTVYRTFAGTAAVPEALEQFLKLFPESRGDKAQFMTAEMQAFFRDLTASLSEIKIMQFGSLELGNKPVAMVMCFDYNGIIYLYNSAYDPEYRSLSAGIVSKVKCIQNSIEQGKSKFDFLKGAEQYKYYLGGKEIPLYSCHITLQPGQVSFHSERYQCQ